MSQDPLLDPALQFKSIAAETAETELRSLRNSIFFSVFSAIYATSAVSFFGDTEKKGTFADGKTRNY